MEHLICNDCVCYWANGDTEDYTPEELERVKSWGYFVPSFATEDYIDYAFYGRECDICGKVASLAECNITII